MTMSSGQQSSPMESSGAGSRPRDDADAPVVSSNSKKKLWRGMQAVYLVLVKKHQPKLEALGVHLHHLLSASKRHRDRRSLAALERDDQNPAALMSYLSSSLSCRSMDPAAAVVHPYPRGGHGGHHRASSSSSRRHAHAAAPSSLSCRSMDPAAAVCRYQYRPREVEFSCKSTPMHRRRRENKRRLRLQMSRAAADEQGPSEMAHYYGSAAAVKTLFALMDVEEEVADEAADDDDDDLDAAVAWPPAVAALGPAAAPRQVRITDSPYLVAREEENNEDMRSAVDRRADEFILWFHEQLRTQQKQQQRSSTLYTQIR